MALRHQAEEWKRRKEPMQALAEQFVKWAGENRIRTNWHERVHRRWWVRARRGWVIAERSWAVDHDGASRLETHQLIVTTAGRLGEVMTGRIGRQEGMSEVWTLAMMERRIAEYVASKPGLNWS